MLAIIRNIWLSTQVLITYQSLIKFLKKKRQIIYLLGTYQAEEKKEKEKEPLGGHVLNFKILT